MERKGEDLNVKKQVKIPVVIFSLIIILLTTFSITANFSHYAKDHGLFGPYMFVYYFMGLAALSLVAGLGFLFIGRSSLDRRCYSISAFMYFIAMFLCLKTSGREDDYWGLLFFFGAAVLIMNVFIGRSDIITISKIRSIGSLIGGGITLFTDKKVSLEKTVGLDKIEEILKKAFGANYKISMLKNGVRIEQDALRGCIVRVKKYDDGTDLFTGPFIPSTKLAVVSSIISVGLAMVVIFKGNVVAGVIILGVSFIARLLPSSTITKETKNILNDFREKSK